MCNKPIWTLIILALYVKARIMHFLKGQLTQGYLKQEAEHIQNVSSAQR